MNNQQYRILVVRNDRLGDFMLSWPVFALLKHYWPDVYISVLLPAYTAPIAELCEWIDEIIIDRPEENTFSDILSLRRTLRHGRFNALLTLFSTGRIALAGCISNIPYRLAPATKLAQLCYNHRLTQRRSYSAKPEYAYNLDLAYHLLNHFNKLPSPDAHTNTHDDFLPKEIHRPILYFDDNVEELKQKFIHEQGLTANAKLIFLHPGSGGSANNLRTKQYVALANNLKADNIAFIISAGPGEKESAKDIVKLINDEGGTAVLFSSREGIKAFARTLQFADLFISGSTGPLHIAAALDRPTAAFYPRHRSATPLRWQTLNAPHKRLSFTPPKGAAAKDVSAIDIDEAARRISETFLS